MKATRIEQLVQAALLIGLGAGCTVGEVGHEKRATAPLESKSGTTVTGMATFSLSGASMVSLKLTLSGASAGQHGVHLHAVGDCSALDASSAMGHWNPSMMTHGLPVTTPHHLGDCGNVDVAADGTGTLNFTGLWTIGTGDGTDMTDIVVHANTDDGTNPMAPATPGNSGARQACGVIVAAP
jgi:Cu-Zn family superoxide dismutase